MLVWLNGLVVSALALELAPPQFLSSKKLGVQKGSLRRLSGYGD